MKIPLSLGRDHAGRKALPIMRVLGYFTAALAGLTRHAVRGNAQHNPGEALHWARGKSMDHAECVGRHSFDMMDLHAWLERNPSHPEREAVLTELEHEYDARLWRAGADSQEFYEKYRGAPVSPSSRLPEPPVVLIDYSHEYPREPVDDNRPCRALSPDADETCLLIISHEGEHVGTYSNWPRLPDAIHGPAGADWREPPPPPNQRGCPEGYYRTTWPKVTKVPGHDYPAVWISKDGTHWYANPDSHEDEVKDRALSLPFKSEAQARAGYWDWKDSKAG